MSERYVKAGELAALMGVSTRTVERMVAAGAPSETWGMRRGRRFLPSAVMSWARDFNDSYDAPGNTATAFGRRRPATTTKE